MNKLFTKNCNLKRESGAYYEKTALPRGRTVAGMGNGDRDQSSETASVVSVSVFSVSVVSSGTAREKYTVTGAPFLPM